MRTAGILLIVGAVLGLIAAGTPSLNVVWTARPPEKLTLIATRQGAWLTANALFALGLMVAVLGVAALVGVLIRADGGLPSSWAALAAFAVGTVLWLVDLGFRLTVTASVSRDVGAGASMPDWYTPFWEWGNSLLGGYVVLASLGLIALGMSVLSTGLLPGWSGWTVMVLGVLFIVTLAIFRDTLPVFPHLGTGLLGVLAVIEGVRQVQ